MRIHKIATGFSDLTEIISMNIFTVGCVHGCAGCHVPQLQDRYYIDAKELLPHDLEVLRDDFYDCVAWMGGDPLLQSKEYCRVNRYIKETYPDKMIVCFTGYDYQEISQDVKDVTDIIIDGKWEGIPYNEQGTNQKIYANGDEISLGEMNLAMCLGAKWLRSQ